MSVPAQNNVELKQTLSRLLMLEVEFSELLCRLTGQRAFDWPEFESMVIDKAGRYLN